MWVKQIAQKVPVISKLEKKLGMLQGLDPVLEGIVSDLDKVTDFSSMIELQKKSGEDLEEGGNFDEPSEANSESTEDLINTIKRQLETASKSSSEAKAAKKAAVEAEQMEDLEKKYSDKENKKKAVEMEKNSDKEAKKKAIEEEKKEEKSKIDIESDEKVKEAEAEATKKVEEAEKKAEKEIAKADAKIKEAEEEADAAKKES